METVSAHDIEELRQFTPDRLQQHTKKLYTAACEYQKHSCLGIGEKDESGHCIETIGIVEQIRLVVKVLIEKEACFKDNHFQYLFSADQGLLMAKAISEIFSKYFHNQCSGAIISTCVTEDIRTKEVIAATVISVTPEEHAKGIVAMTLAMNAYAGED